MIHRALTCLIILLMGLAVVSNGQMAIGLNRDSLRGLIARGAGDTATVNQLIALGQQYENNAPDSAMSYYQRAGALSHRLRYPAGFIRYVSNYTAVLENRGRLKESLQLNLQALDTCMTYRLDALNFMRVYINTGNSYELLGDHASAADYYLKALPIVEARGNSQAVLTLYNSLSGFYRNLQQLPKALDYSRRSLQIAEKEHDVFSTGLASVNLGNTLKDMGQLPAALTAIRRGYAIGEELGDSSLMETALVDIGDCYLRQKQPEQYLPIYRRALVLGRATGDTSGQAYSYLGIGNGLFWTAKYSGAAALLAEAIPFARQHDQKEVWRDLLLLMSDVQAVLQHLAAYRTYRALSDSVSATMVNDALLKHLQELETKYEVEKAQHEILKKDVQLAAKDEAALRQRSWLILAILGATVLGLLALLTWLAGRNRQQLHQRNLRALQAEQENVRLRALMEGQQAERSRISQEMHDDMGSGLTSLLFLSRPLAANGGTAAQKISELSAQLIRKMNEIIWTLNHEHDSLESLVAYIRTNAAQLLEHAGVDLTFETAETLPDRMLSPELRRNIYLVVKEAIHNAVRHSGATQLTMSVGVEAGELYIVLRDNGKGFDESGGTAFGNGLRNMRERVGRIGGELRIDGREGTTVTIRAPI